MKVKLLNVSKSFGQITNIIELQCMNLDNTQCKKEKVFDDLVKVFAPFFRSSFVSNFNLQDYCWDNSQYKIGRQLLKITEVKSATVNLAIYYYTKPSSVLTVSLVRTQMILITSVST